MKEGYMSLRNEKGFSLIEMMTVVAIMGILTSIALPRINSGADAIKAKQVTTEMAAALATIKSRHFTGQTLKDITGSACIACEQGRAIGTDPSTWSNIAAADYAWKVMGYPSTPRDPWGRPYILDENDGEFGPSDCRYDAIYSAGPNGIFDSGGDGDDLYGDDIIIRLPYQNPARCPNHIDDQMGGSNG
jgi:prepilin-type N-terminal cleavage/methylation domain-containing protein